MSEAQDLQQPRDTHRAEDEKSNREINDVREFRKQIEAAIEKTPGNIVITGHAGQILPDGDDIFSVLAMKRILEKKYPDKNPTIVLSERPVHMWDAFMREGEIKWARADTVQEGDVVRQGDLVDHVQRGDLLVCVDQGQLSHFSRFPDRLGRSSSIQTVILDHHTQVTDEDADLRLRESSAVSTTELIARMYPVEELDPETCALLYMGMSSDTGGFRFKKDYGDTMRLANELLTKSGKTKEELEAMVTLEPQIELYERLYQKNHIVIPSEAGGPTFACEYLTPEETMPTVPADNPDFCHQFARRRSVGKMTSKGDSDVQFVITPDNESDSGEMVPSHTTFKLEIRRSSGVTFDLSKMARRLGGGGHQAAAGATWTIPDEAQIYISEHKNDSDFNMMQYVSYLAAREMNSALRS